MKDLLRIATRKSPLALWQAEEVKRRLSHHYPELQIELVTMTTKGDQLLGSPLTKLGGKGLFIKELELAMLDGRADIAVHSVKDVPAQIPEGFRLGPILKRENPFDAFVSNRIASLDELPDNAAVGTCSLRRKAQLLAHNSTLRIIDLRGNINTRLGKLDSNKYDAIILAAAGLERLEMHSRIRHTLDPEISLPAVGQGAIGIEYLDNDEETFATVQILDDNDTRDRVTAERALNLRLNGGCQAPVGGFATLFGDTLTMTGLVATPNGQTVIRETVSGNRSDARSIGTAVANTLLAHGAGQILETLGITLGPT